MKSSKCTMYNDCHLHSMHVERSSTSFIFNIFDENIKLLLTACNCTALYNDIFYVPVHTCKTVPWTALAHMASRGVCCHGQCLTKKTRENGSNFTCSFELSSAASCRLNLKITGILLQLLVCLHYPHCH